MKIPFVNLHQQYLDCRTEIDQAILDTILSSSFITGPDVTRFEKCLSEFVGAEDCASTGSGTTALVCSLRAAGISKGDQVLTTPHTFVATTEAIVSVGAIPIFVDIDPDTHLIDIDQIPDLITNKTKALLFVDIYGQCPDLERVRKVCDQYQLIMIEDAAHSLGARWKDIPVGSISDFTCVSFNPVKNLGAMGDAGCVFGSHKNMEKVRKFRDHGRIGRYDIIDVGYNARIDNMQSNIIMAKLPKLHTWIDRKNKICKYYDAKLKDVVKTIEVKPQVRHGRYVYVIQTPRRDQLQTYLADQGIQTNIHYAVTTHQQPAYKRWYRSCPVAENTVKEILSLPCWYSMTHAQIEYVTDKTLEFFND